MSKSYPDTVPAEFTAEDTKSAYRKGWNHGCGIACHNVPEIGVTIRSDSLGRVTVDAENIREVHADNCYSAAYNLRDYSPFEFTAHEFNEAGDGGVLSFKAVEENRTEIESAIRDGNDSQWHVLACEINWEDPDLFCEHTNERIESAYAETGATADR